MTTSDLYSVEKLTSEARRLAAEYRRTTGKSLPLSAEIAVNDAIRLLGLEAPDENDGACDAIRTHGDQRLSIQVKGRVIFDDAKNSPRIGQIKLDQSWDEMLLVLMDADYLPTAIYAASHATLETTLQDKPANKRGAMSVAQFKIIGDLVWSIDEVGRENLG